MIERSCVLSADKIICISETTLNDARYYYGIESSRFVIARPGYSPAFRQMEPGEYSHELRSRKPILLYIGKRGSYKNFTTLLEAYRIWHRRSEIDLLVVGPDWSNAERKSIAENCCVEQVQLMQEIDDITLACLYNNAQVFVLPSLYEGFGLPLLEAMACGCPVAASRIPSTIEVAGQVPYHFEAQSVDDLLSALNDALDSGRGIERVRSGLERVQRYSWDSCADTTLQAYHSVTGI